jgi:hypothetical protein
MTGGAVDADHENYFLSSQQYKIRRRQSHGKFCKTGS